MSWAWFQPGLNSLSLHQPLTSIDGPALLGPKQSKLLDVTEDTGKAVSGKQQRAGIRNGDVAET